MNLKIFIFTLLLSICFLRSNVKSYDLTNYRLPTWAYPDNYYLNIDLRSPEADTFEVNTWIDINVTEENHYELVLNVDPLYIDVMSSNISVNTSTFLCSKVDYSNVTQLMGLTCEDDMWGNDNFLVQFNMNYTTKYADTSDGLYKHSFEINGTKKSVIYSHFEPTSFRRVFPSFDEPGFKAPIRFAVDHYANLTVVSNMLGTESSDTLGIHTYFNITPPMPTYTFAIVAGSSSDWQHTLIPETDNMYLFIQQIHEDYVSIATANTPILLDMMGQWTGMPYDELGIPKMTLAAVSGMRRSRAMENWGLIIFEEVYLIDEGNRTTIKQRTNMLMIMAHEIAHQWFGNYVTPNWWSELWLAEGFANYFQYYLADTLSTSDYDYEFDKRFIIDSFQDALQADGPSAVPLSNNDSDINTPHEIILAFNRITYNKGASVIRMLRYALGEEVFKQGLHDYLQAKALNSVQASDLLYYLQRALGNDTDIDLSTYMDSWIYQTAYPIGKTTMMHLSVDFYYISVTFYKYSDGPNQEESIWYVPISIITSEDPDPRNVTYTWVGPGTETYGFFIPSHNDSWAIVNAGATGFYRVDYDSDTLARIINVLNNSDTYSDVPTENRAQLVDDLFNIAKINTMKGGYQGSYENAFELAKYLEYETEYFPWHTFLQAVEYMIRHLQNQTIIDALKKDVLALVEAQLVIPDSDNSTRLPPNEILKRNLLLDWACELNHTDSLVYVQTQYNNFLNDTQSIDSNYRYLVICHGIQASDDPVADHDTLMALYSASIMPQEKEDITKGIACASKSALLKNYMTSTLRDVPSVGKQFWPGIFKTMSSRSSEGLDAALYFIVNYFDEITTTWKDVMDIEYLISGISSIISQPEQIKMLKKILEKPCTASTIKAIEDAIKKAEFNFEWREKVLPEISIVLIGR